MENGQKLSIELYYERHYTDINISDNFSPEEKVFDVLAEHIADDYYFNYSQPRVSLTLLEKFEILCKTVREKIYESRENYNHYTKLSITSVDDKFVLDISEDNPQLFDKIKVLSNNFIHVVDSGKHGILNQQQDVILPVNYDKVYTAIDGYFAALKNNKYLIYNLDGKEVMGDLEKVGNNFNPFGADPEYIWLKKNGKWGLFDQNLAPILPFSLPYDSCEVINLYDEDIYIEVRKNGKTGLINGLLNITIIPLNPDIENIFFDRKTKIYVAYNKDFEILEVLPLTEIKDNEEDGISQN